MNVGNIKDIDRKTMEVVFYEEHRCPISRLKTKKLKQILTEKTKK